MLRRLLDELTRQQTENRFTISAVVVDNDSTGSARSAVEDFALQSSLCVEYFIEPERGIARARNKVVACAKGDYLAFIDDDEFPGRTWLLELYRTCSAEAVDGVFGPVLRYFEVQPPKWLEEGPFYLRRVSPTGTAVEWHEARTGNVLLRRSVLAQDFNPFDVRMKTGEDQEFFHSKIELGYRFIWCAEAIAYEVIPPERWKRGYLLRKALLRGQCATLKSDFGWTSVAKSLVAIPVYLVILPFTLILKQSYFMAIAVRCCDHLGKLLSLCGVTVVKDSYVNEGNAE